MGRLIVFNVALVLTTVSYIGTSSHGKRILRRQLVEDEIFSECLMQCDPANPVEKCVQTCTIEMAHQSTTPPTALVTSPSPDKESSHQSTPSSDVPQHNQTELATPIVNSSQSPATTNNEPTRTSTSEMSTAKEAGATQEPTTIQEPTTVVSESTKTEN